MPAQDCDREHKIDISDDIEFISENHIIHHVEVDSDDDNDIVRMV